MPERMSTMMSRYGNRDMFALANLVLRPDGSLFIQGDLSTYRVTALPLGQEVVRPGKDELQVLQSTGVSEVPRRGPTPNPNGGTLSYGRPVNSSILGSSRPRALDDSAHWDPIPSRTVIRERWVDRVFIAPGGQEVVLRRLRRSAQMPGHCVARHTEERQYGRRIA